MKAWDAFLRHLEELLGRQTVDAWLRSLKVVRFDARNLYLEAENQLQLGWFEEHIRDHLRLHFLNNNGRSIKVHLTLKQETKNEPKSKGSTPLPEPTIESDPTDQIHTFSHFILEPANTLLLDLLQALRPHSFNPLFFHGESGCGKTHLLMACANALKEQGLSVFYVHADTFTEHVVKAIRSFHMETFRQVYRNQDVLLIDDVHLFQRKLATQEELFHTFNALHTQGKQIILSSSLPPHEIQEVAPRLISRFEWGIALQVHPLSLSNRGKLLEQRASLCRFPFTTELANWLQSTFSRSNKSTVKALEALMLRYRGVIAPSLEEATTLLHDLIEQEIKGQINQEQILDATCAYFGIRREDVLGKGQSRDCALPRKLAMFFCRDLLFLSYPAIGRLFNRDHSTVMTSIKQIEESQQEDEIKIALKEIRRTWQKD